MSQTQILFADDEADFRSMVSVSLESSGFHVYPAGDGEAAWALLEEGGIDLLISDVNMPELDGFALCQRAREKWPKLPIILLTSRDSEIDEALGLDLGADDYVTKPVSNRVLVARVKALLRRLEARQGADAPRYREAGRLRADIDRMETTVDGDEVDLTVTEFRLVIFFIENAGRVLKRDRLLRAMRDDDSFVSDRMVDSYVNRLRRKIEAVAPDFDAIETVIGMGYRLRER